VGNHLISDWYPEGEASGKTWSDFRNKDSFFPFLGVMCFIEPQSVVH